MKKHYMADYWNSKEWAIMKVDLLTIRGDKCEWCGEKPKYLVMHHLTYENYGYEEFDDVVLICNMCHAIEHGKIKVKKKRKRKKTKRKTITRSFIKSRKPRKVNPPISTANGPKCRECGEGMFVGDRLYACMCGHREYKGE